MEGTSKASLTIFLFLFFVQLKQSRITALLFFSGKGQLSDVFPANFQSLNALVKIVAFKTSVMTVSHVLKKKA